MLAELFANALKKAVMRELSILELLSTVETLNSAGETAFVIALYRGWLENNVGNPLYHVACFNFGVLLSNTQDLEGAREVLAKAIEAAPDFFPPYINIGILLEKMGRTGEGIQYWYAVVNRLNQLTGTNLSHKTAALKQIGRVLEGANIDPQAEEALRLGLELNPNQRDALQHWISLRQRQCKWPAVVPWEFVTRKQLMAGISPLSMAAHSDDPMLQLASSASYSKFEAPQPPVLFIDEHHKLLENRDGERLRIGYLSSDLREHAIGFLTSELYGLHDRSKVEVFAYYCFREFNDGTNQRIRSTVDHWIDINAMTDEEAARRMVADKIDILIDVNGYTNGARQKLLAMRPAPIIVNWLGFPGSLGSPFHNYIIADDFLVPPESEKYFTEKVLRLPCYQPNDRQRIVSPNTPTRQEAGLPEDAMVYCCFNGVQKITPFAWRRWMTILKEVPGSVLWMLDGGEETNKRLKALMEEYGVSPDRLYFAPKMRNPDHLARYPLADLFLDTTPYGAHTTASDAMWMGVPVLTVAGRSFTARVCGSLVTSAGLPDLVCKTVDEYVERAIALGRDRSQLTQYRDRLKANRDTCVLFDTPLLVAKLEELYAQMWEDFKNGAVPRPDLLNLDLYLDIGSEVDSNDVETLTLPDYEEQYRRKLIERNRFQYVHPDRRLWDGENKL